MYSLQCKNSCDTKNKKKNFLIKKKKKKKKKIF